MYKGGPEQKQTLELCKAEHFLLNVDLSKINSFGFYGGEISVNMDLYQKFIDLTPRTKPRFTITNGTWSKDFEKAYQFIVFAINNLLWVKVSSTIEHKKHQNENRLKHLVELTQNLIHIKENDDTKSRLLPMGRLSNQPFSCTMRCLKMKEPYRIAMQPDGNIIFQSCDGVYPIVGNWENSLSDIELNVRRIIWPSLKM
jgi:hypothetical protein